MTQGFLPIPMLGALGLAVTMLVSAATAGSASGPVMGSARWLEDRQSASGGFAEAGRVPDASLTAWASLALVAGDGSLQARALARAFLSAHEGEVQGDTDVALQVLARLALGDRPEALLERLRAHRPGTLVNATIWTVLALRAAGEQPPVSFVRALLRAQAPGGGWAWSLGGRPDSNDTAAAIQALRAAGVGGAPVRRGVASLRSFQRRSGGFSLTPGRAPDAQSTAWAIQALLATGERPGEPALRFLARLRRPDGSYRYSDAYGTTPVWVTAQVLPALAGRPFPLG
jgi:hypothetical protein